METKEILTKVKSGELSVEEAELLFRRQPFEEMGYAKLDTHRKIRSGFAEARRMNIFCRFSAGSMSRMGKCSVQGHPGSSMR